MLVSIIIRTLNEEKYLGELLSKINHQVLNNIQIETVIVDSGSTDKTLNIAAKFGARITTISKDEFTFGRSLNLGCEFALGDILVFISGHCVPVDNNWLLSLINPIKLKQSGYTYGRQIGRDTTKYSERRVFEKYYPAVDLNSNESFFCNNANSAIKRDVWFNFKFEENLTGLEDMELAKRYFEKEGKIRYIPMAVVYHIHNENWFQTLRRYEREAIALQNIMPYVHISIFDTIRYIISAVISDLNSAFGSGCLLKEFTEIIKFRIAQYWGAYKGNHDHRSLSNIRKENYFYPLNTNKE